MMKFIGWVVTIFVLFSVFGFFVDWVDFGKRNTDVKAEYTFTVYHSKVATDCKNFYRWVGSFVE